ncbi:MAG: 16S rRNA (cytidine(1402)-2'-O)-methyltransferase [Bacillota bacterium]
MTHEGTKSGQPRHPSAVEPGSLYVVATPIGNLSDISPRALETLRSVRLVLAEDTRHTKGLLQHFGIEVPMLSFHKFNEKGRASEVIERILAEGISVAIVSDAGTPCISDPGVEIVRAAREAGIPVFGVSGPSAIATAVSVSGLPSREFTFLGFLPRTARDLRAALRRVREQGISTFVVYESPKRIKALADALLREMPDAKVSFCCELTKVHERSYYGPISEVVAALEADPNAERGEYTVVVHLGQDDGSPALRANVGGEAPGATSTRDSRGAESPTNIPLEALLVKAMVERGCTLKEATLLVTVETGASRNEVYQASLRLKSLLG